MLNAKREVAGPRSGRIRPRPGRPAAQHRIYLALLPSGPDAVRRLNLHRVRTAVRRVRIDQCTRRRGGDQARAGPHPVILGRPLMPDAISRAPRVRAERMILATRVALAMYALFAIWLDPAEPARYARLTYTLHASYLAYASVIAAVLWRHSTLGTLPLITHVADIALFSIFQYLTLGPSSPFFVYFVFSLFCGALRWGWRGAIGPAPVVLIAF